MIDRLPIYARKRRILLKGVRGKKSFILSGRQAQAVIAIYLQGCRGITNLEFSALYGAGVKFSNRINEVIKDIGLKVEKVTEERNGVRWKRYVLREPLRIIYVGDKR